MTERSEKTRKGIRRTALVLTAIALAFYFGFILMGVLNS
jgi:uncharacterized membrane protein (DUF485 family)